MESPIKLALNNEQLLFQPISRILDLTFDKHTVPRVSEVLHNRTHISSSSVCNIVRSSNHNPFRVLSRANHKLKSLQEWRQLVNKESLLYKLDQIKNLEYPLDLEAMGQKVVVIFEDGEVIFYANSDHKLQQVKRIKIQQHSSQHKLAIGKIHALKQLNAALFVSARQAVLLSFTDYQVKILANYPTQTNFQTALVSTTSGDINIYIARRKSGVSHYIIKKNSDIVQLQANVTIFLGNTSQKIVVVDIIQVTQLVQHALGQSIFLILSPTYGLLTVKLPLLGSVNRVSAVRTAMTTKNCHSVKLHGSVVYLSCPHIVTYDVNKNMSELSMMLSQLPLELLSNADDVVSISQNRFEVFNNCSGIIQGSLEGQTFHHSAVLGSNYVSVDDISVIMWSVSPPDYFLACRGNAKFMGYNTFTISVHSKCKQNKDQCCEQKYYLELQINGNDEAKHILEIVGVASLAITALLITSLLLRKKLRINREYNQLIEQQGPPQNNRTQQSMVESHFQKNKEPQIFMKD